MKTDFGGGDDAVDDTSPPKKRRKTTKIEGSPKRPMSGYLIFCNEMREQVKKDLPDPKVPGALMKVLGQHWSRMSEVQKKSWNDRASKLMETYKVELKAFKEGKGLITPPLAQAPASPVVAPKEADDGNGDTASSDDSDDTSEEDGEEMDKALTNQAAIYAKQE